MVDFEGGIGREGERDKIPNFEIRAKTVPNERHPDHNEDRTLIMPPKGAAVFDGLGGLAGGEKASQLAQNIVAKSLIKIPKESGLQDTEEKIRQTLIDANEAVYQQAQVDKTDMGTTASVVYIWEGENKKKAIIGNVGDSRVYLFRAGKLDQITLDDGRVRSETSSEEEARKIPGKI